MRTINHKLNPKVNPYINFINNSSYENTNSTNPKKPITPIQFGFNFYFNNIRPSSPFTPINSSKIQNSIKFINNNNINQKIPIYVLFQSSLEKSGYKISTEQYSECINESFNDISNNNNYIEDLNYYNYPVDANYPINNSKIINNIYPSITKVTNVKILSDNNNNNNLNNSSNLYFEKINDIKLESKKETINKSILNVNIKESEPKKEESKKSKIIFECSESNDIGGNKNFMSKIFTKKKRFRKNLDQINYLSKFYMEHKIWSKNEIKEMSKNIGLKENKIYKWLWDQKNKDYNKNTKFIINKNSQ